MKNSQTDIMSRSARLEHRITPSAKELIERAAELEGRKVSDFVTAAAVEAAQRTIADAAILHLSAEAQRVFVDQILNPPAPSAALSKAFARHRALIAE